MPVTIDPLTTFSTASAVTKLNTNLTNLANELQNLIYKNGTEEMNADLDMNGHNFLNVGDATSGGGFVTLSQLQAMFTQFAAELATIVAYGDARADVFDGDGVTTVYTLTDNPGSEHNLDVSIGGVTQVPNIGYNWTGGNFITFTTAPPNGEKVLVRYFRGVPIATGTALELLQGGTDGQTFRKQSNADFDFIWSDIPYTVPITFAYTPEASELLQIDSFSEEVTFLGNWAGAQANVGTLPTANFELDIQKDGVSVGTILIDTAGIVTFSSTGGAPVVFIAGEEIRVVAPVTPDATIYNVSIKLKGTRT